METKREIHSVLLKLFLGIYILRTVNPLTIGQVDRDQLETYEDQSSDSSDLDLFANLTFSFSCEGRAVGLYADREYSCRIFHVCDEEGRVISMICANGTSFDQKQRICDWDDFVDCERAYEWYYLNELNYTVESEEFTTESERNASSDEQEVPSVVPLSNV